jgi:hypothetical protein
MLAVVYFVVVCERRCGFAGASFGKCLSVLFVDGEESKEDRRLEVIYIHGRGPLHTSL